MVIRCFWIAWEPQREPAGVYKKLQTPTKRKGKMESMVMLIYNVKSVCWWGAAVSLSGRNQKAEKVSEDNDTAVFKHHNK